MNLWGCAHEQSSVHIHGMQFKEALKRIDIIILTRKWMQLETQTQKNTHISAGMQPRYSTGGGCSCKSIYVYMCAHACICVTGGGESEGGRRKEGGK